MDRIITVRSIVRNICIACTGSVSFSPTSLGINLWSQRGYFKDVVKMTRLCALRLDELVGTTLDCERARLLHTSPEKVLVDLIDYFETELEIELPGLMPEEGNYTRNAARCQEMRLIIHGLTKNLIGRSEVTKEEIQGWIS